ncbi:unnamed protein product, partial [Anisakis simplex]|uniref:Protein MCM10 homolog (inferred by orthology to a human protein) n=1 Tax=Anisakis simplex TaxID=6269 RepID=A0A0M3J155_ANISI
VSKYIFRNPKISSSIFQTYCDGLEKIRPSRVKSGTSAPSGAWVTMGVVSDKSDYRKSANGHDYMIWRPKKILKDCQSAPLKVFLFGDCLTEHWKIQIGYVIALTTPAFMDGNSKDASVTLKVTKSVHMIEIGFCPDFAICKANKNNGSACKNVVNKSQSDYCIFHIEKMARKLSANRGAFDTSTSNPCRFGANNNHMLYDWVLHQNHMLYQQKKIVPPKNLLQSEFEKNAGKIKRTIQFLQ